LRVWLVARTRSSSAATPAMFRLAGCGRSVVLARLAPRAPAALHGARAPRSAPGRASLATRADGTDVRFRIPAANIPDDEILTIDDEEIEQRRDNSHATRLVQVRTCAGAVLRRMPARAPRKKCTAVHPTSCGRAMRRGRLWSARSQPGSRAGLGLRRRVVTCMCAAVACGRAHRAVVPGPHRARGEAAEGAAAAGGRHSGRAYTPPTSCFVSYRVLCAYARATRVSDPLLHRPQVRDMRIPLSTGHPSVPEWIGTKLRLVVLNQMDKVSEAERSRWASYFTRAANTRVVFTNARTGDGVPRLAKLALSGARAVHAPACWPSVTLSPNPALSDTPAHLIVCVLRSAAPVSEGLNARRREKGLRPRPVRAAVVGFPNVGKSALINRLVGRAQCLSAARPGVTRHLQWVSLGVDGGLMLLDAPGVLPMRLADQAAAIRLAICNDIGEASYTTSLVAAQFIEQLRRHDGARGGCLARRSVRGMQCMRCQPRVFMPRLHA
jgi:ribosome biogenesis GTPase A